jgi:hypothetical protein
MATKAFDIDWDVVSAPGVVADESLFTDELKQSNPEQYNQNALQYFNGMRNRLIEQNQPWSQVQNVDDYIKRLTQEVNDPTLYYAAKLDNIANNIGRDNAMGQDPTHWQQQLEAIIPEAIQAGVPVSSLQNILDTSYNAGQGRGSYQLKSNWENVGGITNKYGYLAPALLAGAGLAAGAGAAAGAGVAAGEGAAAGGGALTTGEILASSGFTPIGGASFAIEPGVAYTAGAGAVGGNVGGLGTNAALQGPTYGELGYTGVPEGGMGPTYAEMGNTGLNTEQAINAADAASRNSQIAEALKTANQVRQGYGVANNLAKLLSSGSQAGSRIGSQAGSQLANAAQNLAQGQTGVGMAIPALIRGNQNPFLQTAQQPIRNAQPMDLSSLANALRQG